jgi:hypothetical protein
MSQADFVALVHHKIGLRLRIGNGVKICDIRPAFGKIFEDYLKDYPFWGYGDIDVLYGCIDHFMTEDLLSTYDFISTSREVLAGHFTLCRNTPKINSLYQRIKGFNKLAQWYWPLQVDESFFSNLVKNLNKNGEIKCFMKDMIQHDIHKPPVMAKDWSITWNKGHMVDTLTQKELMYFHFMLSKESADFVFPAYQEGMQSFCLSGQRITPRMKTLKGRIRRKINAYLRKKLSQ